MRRILLALSLLISSLQTGFADPGQTLHTSQCIACHSRMTGGDGHVLYTRHDRLATTLEKLRRRVGHCAQGANTDWTNTQIKAVAEYLNSRFYDY